MTNSWLFSTEPHWSARISGRPRGDSTAAWCAKAVPEIVRQGRGSAPTPAVVVARVGVHAVCAPKGRAKALLDALHDGRRSGPWYSELGAPAPLPGDDPGFVIGLAVEVREAEDEYVHYSLGRELGVKGPRLSDPIEVPLPAPNDVAADASERQRIARKQIAYARGVVEAWSARPRGALSRERAVGVVIRHRPGRDEDNTWETWLAALTGSARWSREAWPAAAPLASAQITSVASVADPALRCEVRYELYDAGPARAPSSRTSRPRRSALDDAPDGELVPLTTLPEFTAALSRPGVVVITDTANPTRAHRPSCSFVTTQNFAVKVLKNGSRTGRYYWAPRLRTARTELGAAPCSFCQPD